MIHPRKSAQPVISARARTLLAVLVCSVISACSAPSPFAQSDSTIDGEDSRSLANGRVLNGRALGRYETAKPSTSDQRTATASRIAAYQRDQRPPTAAAQSAMPPALTMADRWRPAARANDQDGDGVVDSRDACPDTAASVTVDTGGCGLFDATLGEVVFSSGSRVLSETARGRLDQLAETLLAFPESRIRVRAHTDSLGSASLNQQLSAARAESVVQYLQSRGVHPEQLQAVGMGESMPLVSNALAAGQQRNRRVDIVTLPDRDAGEMPAMPVRAVTLLASNEPNSPTTEQTPATAAASAVIPLAREKSAEPGLRAAKPVVKVKRPNPPVMPLPKPGFAPGVRISGVVDDLSFAAGSAELPDDVGAILESVTSTLRDNPQVRIVVMAHTDDQGDADRNLQLSRQRAKAVVDYLVGQGIAAERLDSEGYGELLPLVQNVTAEDRARNRRVEIRVQRN